MHPTSPDVAHGDETWRLGGTDPWRRRRYNRDRLLSDSVFSFFLRPARFRPCRLSFLSLSLPAHPQRPSSGGLICSQPGLDSIALCYQGSFCSLRVDINGQKQLPRRRPVPRAVARWTHIPMSTQLSPDSEESELSRPANFDFLRPNM